MKRALGAIVGLGLLAILAGCTTTAGPKSSGSSNHYATSANARAQATSNWAFAGVWRVEDYTETAIGARKCKLELFATQVNEQQYRLRLLQPCHSELRNIVAWRPEGELLGDAIIIVDGGGQDIVRFERVDVNLYRGEFMLTNGEKVQAQLVRS